MATMAIDYVEIGRRLREAREEKGWSQGQVGKRLRKTAAAVSLIEKGRSHGIDTIDQYAAIMGCPLTVYISRPGDRVAALLARLGETLPHSGPATVATLEALVDLWEREDGATRTG